MTTGPGLDIASSLFSPTTGNDDHERVPVLHYQEYANLSFPKVSPTGRLHDCRAALNATGPGGALSSVFRALGFPLICLNEHGNHCNINSLS